MVMSVVEAILSLNSDTYRRIIIDRVMEGFVEAACCDLFRFSMKYLRRWCDVTGVNGQEWFSPIDLSLKYLLLLVARQQNAHRISHPRTL